MTLNICYQQNPQSLVGKYVYTEGGTRSNNLTPNRLYEIIYIDVETINERCALINFKGDDGEFIFYAILGDRCSHLDSNYRWKVATRDAVKKAKASGTFPMLAR